MGRFSQKNLYINYKDNMGMIYDIPTSTMFKTTSEIAKYLAKIQSTMEEDAEEYMKMIRFMEKKLIDKQEIHPTHMDFLKCGHLHKLTIVVSNTCNLVCKYCLENWTIESLKEYLTEKFKIPKEKVMVIHAIGENEICFESPVSGTEINEKYIDIDNLSIFRTINAKFQSDLFCNSGYTSIALMPNGDLYPCHMYAMDRKYLFGTFDYENREYYDLEKLTNLIRKAFLCNNEKKGEDCKNCWARNLCHICPAKVLIDKKLNSISRENCDIRRKNIGNLFFSEIARQTS